MGHVLCLTLPVSQKSHSPGERTTPAHPHTLTRFDIECSRLVQLQKNA